MWFTFISALCLLMSSTISLTAVIVRMRKRGLMVTYYPVGDLL